MILRSIPCLFLVLALTGCDRLNRVRECRRLSGLVNPKLDRIEALAKKGKPPDYQAAARSYGTLALEVRRAAPQSVTGKALVNEYAGVLESVAPVVSAYAVALENPAASTLDETRRSLDRLTKHERGVVARIAAYCQAP